MFAAAAFHPFRTRAFMQNGAVVQTNQTLNFPVSGLIATTEAPKWLAHAIEQNSLNIDLQIMTHDVQQFGPARIFTISHNTKSRNLTIAQEGADLIVRVRSPLTDPNGLPSYRVPGAFGQSGDQSLKLAVRPGELTVQLRGREVLKRSLPQQPMSNWDPAYRVAIGNEITGDRPWLGIVRRAIVTANGEEIDLMRSNSGFEKPAWYLPGWDMGIFSTPAEIARNPRLGLDCALNWLCFIPIGLTLALLLHNGQTVLRTTLICGAISFATETSQFFMVDHYPSVVDLVLNTSGAFAGALLANFYVQTRPRNKHSVARNQVVV